MHLRFWGTRGSIAMAGPTTVRYGGNTSCVELRSARGTVVVLDCGTGANLLGRHLVSHDRQATSGHILISHTHWDHIQGFPFFAPFRVPGNRWDVYGPCGLGSSLQDALSGQMEYTYFPIRIGDLAASVSYHDLVEGSFEIDDILVTTQYLNHPALTIGYRLEVDGVVVVYASDHEPNCRRLAQGQSAPIGGGDERHLRFVEGADLLIHDTQYTAEEYPSKHGWGHSTVEYAVDTAKLAGVKELALYHHDPFRDDGAVDRLLGVASRRATRTRTSLEVFAAAEGMERNLKRAVSPKAPVSESRQSSLSQPHQAFKDRCVLIAMSEKPLSAVLIDAVRSEGMISVVARDAADALKLAGSKHPVLLIVDPAFDGGTGLDLCRAVRAQLGLYGGDVPILAIGVSSGQIDYPAESAAGVSDWLHKPFDVTYARTRLRAMALRTVCRWVRAPEPIDEAERLHALRALKILHTPAEERFDRHTRIAAELFHVPIALVSLVDSDRQWFKSRYGLEVPSAPRDAAFCAHAILDREVFQVSDTLRDDRFAENPHVTGQLRIRFYAGVPLTVPDHHRVGTLCILDHAPRHLSETQLGLLRDLGKLVERELNAGPPQSDVG